MLLPLYYCSNGRPAESVWCRHRIVEHHLLYIPFANPSKCLCVSHFWITEASVVFIELDFAFVAPLDYLPCVAAGSPALPLAWAGPGPSQASLASAASHRHRVDTLASVSCGVSLVRPSLDDQFGHSSVSDLCQRPRLGLPVCAVPNGLVQLLPWIILRRMLLAWLAGLGLARPPRRWLPRPSGPAQPLSAPAGCRRTSSREAASETPELVLVGPAVLAVAKGRTGSASDAPAWVGAAWLGVARLRPAPAAGRPGAAPWAGMFQRSKPLRCLRGSLPCRLRSRRHRFGQGRGN